MSPCGACKFLRRRCTADCLFAPYFDSDEEGTAHFTAMHKVFGASNMSKLLLKIPVNRRQDAVFTLRYEALARETDPVYGCVSDLFSLQNQVMRLKTELAMVQSQLSTLKLLLASNLQTNSQTEAASSSNAPLDHNNNNNNNVSKQQEGQEDHIEVPKESMNFTTLLGLEDHVDDEDGELDSFGEYFSKYLTGDKSRPSSPI